MDGVLVVNKPKGMTSFDVVRRVRGITRERKVGHTGTLDPQGTGVLPLVIGQATKLARFLTEAEKEYRATLCLGIETDTQDADGRVIAERPVGEISEECIRKVVTEFVGEIEQVPPMHSAVRIDGERLYLKARRGEVVERQPRRVTIYRLELVSVDPPYLQFVVRTSKGVYVRTLAADIGARLGVGAHLVQLERTEGGGFTLQEAHSLEQLEEIARLDRTKLPIIPFDRALPALIRLPVDTAVVRKVANGKLLTPSDLGSEQFVTAKPGTRFAVVDQEDRLLAIAEVWQPNYPGSRPALRSLRVFTRAA